MTKTILIYVVICIIWIVHVTALTQDFDKLTVQQVKNRAESTIRRMRFILAELQDKTENIFGKSSKVKICIDVMALDTKNDLDTMALYQAITTKLYGVIQSIDVDEKNMMTMANMTMKRITLLEELEKVMVSFAEVSLTLQKAVQYFEKRSRIPKKQPVLSEKYFITFPMVKKCYGKVKNPDQQKRLIFAHAELTFLKMLFKLVSSDIKKMTHI